MQELAAAPESVNCISSVRRIGEWIVLDEKTNPGLRKVLLTILNQLYLKFLHSSQYSELITSQQHISRHRQSHNG